MKQIQSLAVHGIWRLYIIYQMARLCYSINQNAVFSVSNTLVFWGDDFIIYNAWEQLTEPGETFKILLL